MTTVQQVTSHHWHLPASPFTVRTGRRVRIVGHPGGRCRVPDRPALVFAHGLMGWHRKPRFAVFAELLTDAFTVYAPDLRGHGESGGVSDYGGAEIWDIEAVVQLARGEGHGRVVTAGTSMGGIAVMRHAALMGEWTRSSRSPPSRTGTGTAARTRTRAGRSMRGWARRPAGPPCARGACGCPRSGRRPESPEDVVGKIAPTPIVIVHGRDDPLFSVDHAERLYEAAGEPKHLLIGDRFGHAEDGLTPAFAERLTTLVLEELAPA